MLRRYRKSSHYYFWWIYYTKRFLKVYQSDDITKANVTTDTREVEEAAAREVAIQDRGKVEKKPEKEEGEKATRSMAGDSSQ